MRAFKHIDLRKKRELDSVFSPTLFEDWPDHEDLHTVPISIWDHWLYLSGSQSLLHQATSSEEQEWNSRFDCLSKCMLDNTDVFYMSWRKRKKLPYYKSVRSLADAAFVLSSLNGYKFTLALPEFEAFYTLDHDFTAFFHCLHPDRASRLLEWSKDCGLNVIKERA